MGIFDAIGAVRDRILRRDAPATDLSDIRSHVVGEPYNDPYANGPQAGTEPPGMEQPGPPPAIRFRNETAGVQRGGDRFGFREEEPLRMDDEFGPPPGPGREPMGMNEQPASADYEIRDRLSMIEAQLSAIRSQTETINERLKNMEMRMGARRY